MTDFQMPSPAAGSETPRLTDRAALLRNRQRALSSDTPALFLQEAAIEEVQHRLSLVNRTFTKPAIVTGFADIWQAQGRRCGALSGRQRGYGQSEAEGE